MTTTTVVSVYCAPYIKQLNSLTFPLLANSYSKDDTGRF